MKKMTNAKFLKEVKALQEDKNFAYTDETGKTWTGEMAIAKHFGMTRVQLRTKKAEALKEARAAEEAKAQKKAASKKVSEAKSKRTSEKTAQDVIDSMTDEQRTVLYAMVEKALTQKKTGAKKGPESFGKRIDVKSDKNGKYYVELPDGYRLIFDNTGYVGRYDPNGTDA